LLSGAVLCRLLLLLLLLLSSPSMAEDDVMDDDASDSRRTGVRSGSVGPSEAAPSPLPLFLFFCV
jgi:hypothetical protein